MIIKAKGFVGTLQNNLHNLIFSKAILMLLVVLYHSCVFWTGIWWDAPPIVSSDELGLLAKWLNSYHIYAFTLISGYVFAYKKREGAYNCYLTFILKKAERLLLPYAFVALFWCIPISYFLFKFDCSKILNKYVLCINPEQLWFLWMLFFVFVIAFPLFRFFAKKQGIGWLIVLVFYAIGVIGKKLYPNIFCIWTACMYIPFFFLGVRLRMQEETKEKSFADFFPCYGWFIVDICIFAAITLIGQPSSPGIRLLIVGLSFVLHSVGSIMAFSILNKIAVWFDWENNKVIRVLASYSMPMYLFHQQIIYFTIIAFNGTLNPWFHAIVNFVAALGGSFLISSVLMNWNITRVMIGEKPKDSAGLIGQ